MYLLWFRSIFPKPSLMIGCWMDDVSMIFYALVDYPASSLMARACFVSVFVFGQRLTVKIVCLFGQKAWNGWQRCTAACIWRSRFGFHAHFQPRHFRKSTNQYTQWHDWYWLMYTSRVTSCISSVTSFIRPFDGEEIPLVDFLPFASLGGKSFPDGRHLASSASSDASENPPGVGWFLAGLIGHDWSPKCFHGTLGYYWNSMIPMIPWDTLGWLKWLECNWHLFSDFLGINMLPCTNHR